MPNVALEVAPNARFNRSATRGPNLRKGGKTVHRSSLGHLTIRMFLRQAFSSDHGVLSYRDSSDPSGTWLLDEPQVDGEFAITSAERQRQRRADHNASMRVEKHRTIGRRTELCH
jgi:hypothetical protein